MEKITKELKSISKFLGFIALYQVYNLVQYISSLDGLDISTADAMTQQFMPVVKVLSAAPFVLSIVVLGFLAIKGHQEANDPSPAKFHIVLAVIWMICSALSTVGTVFEVVKGASVLLVLDMLFTAATTVLLFFYSKYAKEIRTVE